MSCMYMPGFLLYIKKKSDLRIFCIRDIPTMDIIIWHIYDRVAFIQGLKGKISPCGVRWVDVVVIIGSTAWMRLAEGCGQVPRKESNAQQDVNRSMNDDYGISIRPKFFQEYVT